MDALIGLISILAFVICTVLLLVALIRKKPKKKILVAMGACIVCFFAAIFMTAMEGDGFNRLNRYDWGNTAASILHDIGVEKVQNVSVQDNDDHTIIYDVTIETECGKVSLYPSKSSDGTWEILWISNIDIHDFLSRGADFYVCDSLKYDKNGALVKDIYDYQTGELLEAKNEEAALLEAKRRQELLDSVMERANKNEISGNSSTDVTSEAEQVLMQITEDIAKQIAQNPSTVKFKTLYWGFARSGRTYTVQGTFECSNLFGVKEEHDLQVWCEASDDYSKIQPYEVYLDGEKIA